MSRISLSSIPSQHPTKVVDFPRLDGGLNLWELDYRLSKNQSPEMKNLWWQDGVLQCRDGQEYVVRPDEDQNGYALSEPFWDHLFLHVGTQICYVDYQSDDPEYHVLYTGLPENRGTFFRYGDWLMYKNRGAYVKIKYDPDTTPVFSAVDMTSAAEAATPTTVINANPETGSGDLYQPENRLSPRKRITYNAKEGVTTYKLPVTNVDSIVSAKVSGQAASFTSDLVAGTVTFATAPPVTEPATNNTVEIVYSKANPGAYSSVMDCPYAIVAGGESRICIVLGGCPAQPNAFFWNANDELSMNAGYFPMTNYQLAGDTEDPVTGFGRQYGQLIVFKERSVGKSDYTIETIDGRDSISFTFININSHIGCDLPWTIRLVENNLVFCNTYQGVHILLDSSAAHENNVVCISRNINGTDQRPGLFAALRDADRDQVCAYDDKNRYWICAPGQVYQWDYVLSSYTNPSWFYQTSIYGVSFARVIDRTFHLDNYGRLTRFARVFADYNEAIEKVYQFPPQFFETYDRLKDVLYCIFTIRSDTDSEVRIFYESDYEKREDLTPISSLSWHLVPRNLAYRCLRIQHFAHVARRKPGCRHVRHFSIRLENSTATQDLAILSAQIYYRYIGRDR